MDKTAWQLVAIGSLFVNLLLLAGVANRKSPSQIETEANAHAAAALRLSADLSAQLSKCLVKESSR